MAQAAWLAIAAATGLAALAPATAKPNNGIKTTITNFDSKGAQVTRFDTDGNAVDAHDGQIAFFEGVYYLYGTSYDCGFVWQKPNAPFCGFKCYSSTDLVHWKDLGFLFNAATPEWQARCNGNTYGGYRPKVVYNASTHRYVMWFNAYDNSSGYHAFTSATPFGPFTPVADPVVAANKGVPPGLNNGDQALFVDDDGVGYIAYTDWRTGGGIVIERLTPDYLTGTGDYIRTTKTGTEAPSLFKRNGIYYLTYSDPNCGYCGGTGTSYMRAKSPLGDWEPGGKISPDSAGGQPSFVEPIETKTGTVYLYGSDLWNNGARNEALANFYWAPLSFAPDGSINQLTAENTCTLALAVGAAGRQQKIADLDRTGGVDGYRTHADIAGNIARSQSFVAGRTGILTSISYTTFQIGDPNADLELAIYKADTQHRPAGPALFQTSIPAASVGWSARNVTVQPNIPVSWSERYAIVVKSGTSSGAYGFAYNDAHPYVEGVECYSNDSGATWTVEKNRTAKFVTTVKKR